jgi:hypothetical protein
MVLLLCIAEQALLVSVNASLLERSTVDTIFAAVRCKQALVTWFGGSSTYGVLGSRAEITCDML